MNKTTKKVEKKRVDWFTVQWKDNKGKSYSEQFPGIRYGIEFDDVRKRMTEIEETYSDDFEKFKIERETKYGYGDDTWDEYIIYGWREETDEEFTARVGEAAAKETEREAREKAEYERLKKKFETS